MKKYTVEVWDNGDKLWYLNNKYHREDGPAIEWNDGIKEWWLHGKKLTEEEFNEITKKCEVSLMKNLMKLLKKELNQAKKPQEDKYKLIIIENINGERITTTYQGNSVSIEGDDVGDVNIEVGNARYMGNINNLKLFLNIIITSEINND